MDCERICRKRQSSWNRNSSVNSGELDPPVPDDVDPTLVVIEEQYYKERFDSNQIYLS
jgi:hypothetical protein